MEVTEVHTQKLLIEAYSNIKDKTPLYTFRKTTMNDAVNLAEVLMEGKEVGYVEIVDEPSDTVLKEYQKK